MTEYKDYITNEIVTLYKKIEPKYYYNELVDCIIEFKLGCSEYRKFNKLKVYNVKD